MKTRWIFIVMIMVALLGACQEEPDTPFENKDHLPELDFSIVGTNQTIFFNNQSAIEEPSEGTVFFGQDATYSGNEPSYTDNGDGTVTDNNTGLMWQKDPGEKMTWKQAADGAESFTLAGYDDWRLPGIKELYSLIIFSGRDIDPQSETANTPFINADYFEFKYGDTEAGERIIDAQYASSTLDVGDTQFGGGNLMFGVNFADGRIKGYPTGPKPGQSMGKTFFVLYVRGNEKYGRNNFVDNGDGTVSDKSTGLMWLQNDSGEGLNWQKALEYAENAQMAGFSDWRLPDAKELQSIVDYERAPGTSNSAAIDPVFNCTQITNEAGQADYPFYWTGTTHANQRGGESAVYISFGRAMGYFRGTWQDVHGAGAQRSDPKAGDPSNWPSGRGPQGDAIRINNYLRLVRTIE